MALWLISVLALLGTAACATQDKIDYLGRFLGVKVQVADNYIKKSELTLTNMGSSMIHGGDWVIYFCSKSKVISPTADTPDELSFLTYGFNISHVQGCLHYLAPGPSFRDLAPGEDRTVVYQSEYWSVAKTDFFPNWFASSHSGNVAPRTIMSTTGESLGFVGAFDMAKKWKRYQKDRFDPLTPQMRFMNIEHVDQGAAAYERPIVPTPVKSAMDMDKMVYFNTGDWVIVADKQDQMLYRAAHLLSYKTKWPITSDQPMIRYVKLMKGDPMVEIRGVLSDSEEAYMLVVNETTQSATIMTNTAAGAFYGVMSLMSQWGDNMESKQVMIKDAPRFPYRGLMLDVARNFLTKDYVMKLLDVMGMYKLNKLHLHLANDEGWRLEIPGLPELTEVGSRRCYDPEEKECLMSQLGSGPNQRKVGKEYFTVAEYQEILKYAGDRHIEVIPEIPMPSYARAAIVSMKKRHYEYKRKNYTDPLEYSLVDYGDTSTSESYSKYKDSVMNPCLESTYKFAKHVVMQVTKMHQGVNPLKTFNFLGKAEPYEAWKDSSACADLMSRMESLKNVYDLRKYFAVRMSNITAEFGLGMATWADALFDHSGKPTPRSMFPNEYMTGYAWNNVWEMGKANQAYMLANYDYKVVLSHATHLYLNQPHEAHPDEMGEIKAARFVDTAKIFKYTPEDVYANVDFNMYGDRMTRDDLCAVTTGESPCIPLSKPKYILGMEASLWTSVVRTEEQADAMLFPRLLAFAERSWHQADWEMEADPATRMTMMKSDWESFANTLGHQELPRMDSMGVAYHIPAPGAKLIDGRLQTKCSIPGLKVEYSVDNGKWWNTEQGVYLSGNVMFRTRSANMGRTSRTEKEMFDAVRFRSLCKSLYLP